MLDLCSAHRDGGQDIHGEVLSCGDMAIVRPSCSMTLRVCSMGLVTPELDSRRVEFVSLGIVQWLGAEEHVAKDTRIDIIVPRPWL